MRLEKCGWLDCRCVGSLYRNGRSGFNGSWNPAGQKRRILNAWNGSSVQSFLLVSRLFLRARKLVKWWGEVAWRGLRKGVGGEKQEKRRRGGFIKRFGPVMHDEKGKSSPLLLSCSNKRKNHGHGRTPTTPREEMARDRQVATSNALWSHE